MYYQFYNIKKFKNILKDLEKQHISYKSLEKRLDDILRGWDKVNDEVDSSNKKIKNTLEDYDDLEDYMKDKIENKLNIENQNYTIIPNMDTFKIKK